jgi:hypothetical protein
MYLSTFCYIIAYNVPGATDVAAPANAPTVTNALCGNVGAITDKSNI